MSKLVPLDPARKPNAPRRMTPELLEELIRIHSQCVHSQEGRRPLVVFVKPLTWEINQALGLANEEDRGFRRADPMCAARPLSVPFIVEEEG